MILIDLLVITAVAITFYLLGKNNAEQREYKNKLKEGIEDYHTINFHWL